jgi:hypothetical protein
MADINDKERGIGPETKALNRTLSKGPDAGSGGAEPATESKFWPSATKLHRVIFPDAAKIGLVSVDAKFDFKPAGAEGKSGGAEGTGVALTHNGKYRILKSTADSFELHVTIGTSDNPTEDIDATLSIDKSGATVRGTLKGEAQTAGQPLPVLGRGTAADPFRVKFPTQEVDWYLQ